MRSTSNRRRAGALALAAVTAASAWALAVVSDRPSRASARSRASDRVNASTANSRRSSVEPPRSCDARSARRHGLAVASSLR